MVLAGWKVQIRGSLGESSRDFVKNSFVVLSFSCMRCRRFFRKCLTYDNDNLSFDNKKTTKVEGKS